jgi:mono/diheme cytochrome c family protein
VWLGAAVAAVLALTALALAGRYGGEDYGPPAAQAAPAQVGVSTGAYTEEQAARGAEVFAARCSGCHGPALQGGMGPRLDPLDESWQGMSLAALFRFVSTNMPFNAPGSLEPQQYADVIAHVLASNGFPPGDAELPPDEEALEAFVIDAPPAE